MKSILPLGVAITVLALVFAGCSNDAAFDVTHTQTDTIPALSGPGNLIAHPTDAEWGKDGETYQGRDKYAGVVYLTWEPVIDAKGYEIYRKDLSDPTSNPVFVAGIINGLNAQATSYSDQASAFNVIKGWSDKTDTPAEQEANKNQYLYTVFALSSKSTDGGRSALDVVQNGRSDVYVHPYIPTYYLNSAPNPTVRIIDLANATTTPHIKIIWTPATGTAEYKVQRQEVLGANQYGEISLVPPPTGDTYKIDPTLRELVATDSTVVVRHSYQYRVASWDRTASEFTGFSNWVGIGQEPFLPIANVTVSASTNSATSIDVTATVSSIFADGKAMLYPDEKLRLYRAEMINGVIQNSYAQVTEIAYNALSDNDTNGVHRHTFRDTGVTANKAYSYKACVIAKDGAVLDLNSTTPPAYAVTIIPSLTPYAGNTARPNQYSTDAYIDVAWVASAGTNANMYTLEREIDGPDAGNSFLNSGLYEGTDRKLYRDLAPVRNRIRYRIASYNGQPVTAAWSPATTAAPFNTTANLTSVSASRITSGVDAGKVRLTVTIGANTVKLYAGESFTVERKLTTDISYTTLYSLNTDVDGNIATIIDDNSLWLPTGTYTYQVRVYNNTYGSIGNFVVTNSVAIP
jgi:hypothetical protein